MLTYLLRSVKLKIFLWCCLRKVGGEEYGESVAVYNLADVFDFVRLFVTEGGPTEAGTVVIVVLIVMFFIYLRDVAKYIIGFLNNLIQCIFLVYYYEKCNNDQRGIDKETNKRIKDVMGDKLVDMHKNSGLGDTPASQSECKVIAFKKPNHKK